MRKKGKREEKMLKGQEKGKRTNKRASWIRDGKGKKERYVDGIYIKIMRSFRKWAGLTDHG